MDGFSGDFGQGYSFKVANPRTPNNIIQMKSGASQAPFIAGGNQVAFYLGLKGNTHTAPTCCSEGEYSATKKTIKAYRRK